MSAMMTGELQAGTNLQQVAFVQEQDDVDVA